MNYHLLYWDDSANVWRLSVVSPGGESNLNAMYQLRARYNSYDYYAVVEENDPRYIAALNNGGCQ